MIGDNIQEVICDLRESGTAHPQFGLFTEPLLPPSQAPRFIRFIKVHLHNKFAGVGCNAPAASSARTSRTSAFAWRVVILGVMRFSSQGREIVSGFKADNSYSAAMLKRELVETIAPQGHVISDSALHLGSPDPDAQALIFEKPPPFLSGRIHSRPGKTRSGLQPPLQQNIPILQTLKKLPG